jgi:hypothetical protein
MHKDNHLMFEAYKARFSESHPDPTQDYTCEYAHEGCDCDGCEECKANQTQSEDAESSGDDIMARIEQKRKERKNIGSVRGEDAETWGVEGKIKAALQEVEGVGYTGDHIDPMEVAKLVVGSQANWGDDYQSLVQALAHVIEAYYEKGLQDS